MIRAVELVTNPSGTYFNASQGTFVQVDVGQSIRPVPVTLGASFQNGSLELRWVSQSGARFRVETKTPSLTANWVDISGSLTATSSAMRFVDTNAAKFSGRLYRVVSE
jgi:hypothetical protein